LISGQLPVWMSRAPPIGGRLAWYYPLVMFARGHGTENDFVIILDPDDSHGFSSLQAARLCDRRAGIGGDGVLRAVRTTVISASVPHAAGVLDETAAAPEWFMDYRNADGTVAEMCGNGLRVFARFLAEQGLVRDREFRVMTRSGLRRVRLEYDDQITAEMGPAAVLGASRAVVNGQQYQGLHISVGNPHLACLVDRPLADFDLTEPPLLDPVQFPEGGNLELVHITGTRAAAMRVYERGSGETRSCGTGAVAAATAAACSAGPGDGSWHISLSGGDLTVELAENTSWITGPAVIVGVGELSEAWLAASSSVGVAGHQS
jgi:diaminopimelate epimerase